MKIYLANQSKQALGGGFTFLHTFEKYLKRKGHQVVGSWKDADVYFISGATMVTRDEVQEAKKAGKKIVLRIDNIPKNSRNRNTGTSRLYDFAQLADLVVFQSTWAKEYIGPFIKKDGPVILNGADTDIFNKQGEAQPKDGERQYGFLQFNRDETKQWHKAWYEYQMIQRKDPGAHLWIIGRFSPENIEYNFDFFMGEKFRYIGIIENPEDLAEYYRSIDRLLIPYFNDACSNTLIEALNCGVRDFFVDTHGMGGAADIMKAPLKELSADFMVDRYIEEMVK